LGGRSQFQRRLQPLNALTREAELSNFTNVDELDVLAPAFGRVGLAIDRSCSAGGAMNPDRRWIVFPFNLCQTED
jgi:hypothetical protein